MDRMCLKIHSKFMEVYNLKSCKVQSTFRVSPLKGSQNPGGEGKPSKTTKDGLLTPRPCTVQDQGHRCCLDLLSPLVSPCQDFRNVSFLRLIDESHLLPMSLYESNSTTHVTRTLPPCPSSPRGGWRWYYGFLLH